MEAWLNARANSPHTRRAYARQVTAAMGGMGVRSLSELTGEAVGLWRAQVLARGQLPRDHPRRLAPNSVAHALDCLRSFLRFAVAAGTAKLLSGEVLKLMLEAPAREVQRPYVVLDDQELGRLMAAARSSRDRALIGLMAGAALRISETVGVDCGDLVEETDGRRFGLWVQDAKGGAGQVAALPPDVARLVLAHLEDTGRSTASPGALFRAGPGRRRLGAAAARAIVEDLAKRAGIRKSITPHGLRHTAAMRLLTSSGNVATVQRTLRHLHPNTTMRYLAHVDVMDLGQEMPPLPTGPAPARPAPAPSTLPREGGGSGSRQRVILRRRPPAS